MFLSRPFSLFFQGNKCIDDTRWYLAETEYHITLRRAVMLQELVTHPTKLHSRCPHAVFIIGALLAYFIIGAASAKLQRQYAKRRKPGKK